MKALWNGKKIAESDQTIMVENNHYFPPDSVDMEYLQESKTQTVCPWKGVASYYNIIVDGKINKDAAWFYPSPKPAAGRIQDFIAFWKGVQVVDE